MTKTELWNKAYKKMIELYGENPDFHIIISRFLSEKQAFSQLDCITYFDSIGKLRAEIAEKGEILIGKGVLGSCFTAYLLGATDVNPLPLHTYCPNCKKTVFFSPCGKGEGRDIPNDLAGDTCECGDEYVYEGYDIPFETYLPYVKKGVEFNHSNYRELYAEIRSHITPSLCELSDKCKEMERRTGVSSIYRGDETVLSHYCAGDFVGFSEREARILKGMAAVAKPKTYGDILKLLSLGGGTQTWTHNAEELLADGACSLADIPATRDEVFMIIRDAMRDRGYYDYDTGFAYEVSSKAWRGQYLEQGMDDYTADMLRHLGFGEWFIGYLLRVHYMSPKALEATELQYRIQLGWYQLNYPDLYDGIMR